MALTAYIDESGTDERSPVFVFAGYVGTPEQMHEFSGGWPEQLALPPRIRQFKFADAAGLRHEFHGMSNNERTKKLAALTKFARKHSAFSFAVIVPKSDFERASRAVSGRKKHFNPWVLGFSAIFKAIRWYQKLRNINEQIHCIFDNNDIYADKIADSWSKFRNNCSQDIREMLAEEPPRFASDRDVLPLQAADLLAGTMRCIWHEKLTGTSFLDLSWFGAMTSDLELSDHSKFHHVELTIRRNDWINYFMTTLSHLIIDDEKTSIVLPEIFVSLAVGIVSYHQSDSAQLVHLDVCGPQTEYVSRLLSHRDLM